MINVLSNFYEAFTIPRNRICWTYWGYLLVLFYAIWCFCAVYKTFNHLLHWIVKVNGSEDDRCSAVTFRSVVTIHHLVVKITQVSVENSALYLFVYLLVLDCVLFSFVCTPIFVTNLGESHSTHTVLPLCLCWRESIYSARCYHCMSHNEWKLLCSEQTSGTFKNMGVIQIAVSWCFPMRVFLHSLTLPYADCYKKPARCFCGVHA